MVRSNRRFLPLLRKVGDSRRDNTADDSDEDSSSSRQKVSVMRINTAAFDFEDNKEYSRVEELSLSSRMTIDACDTMSSFSGTDLFRHLSSVPDKLLTFVAAGCLARSTDADFERFLVGHDADFRKNAFLLWKNPFSSFNNHLICNGCGKQVSRLSKCCGAILKYIRVGAFNQLVDIVKLYMDKIMEIRKRLKNGKEKNHNLTGKHLKIMWQNETNSFLNLTVMASIDGVGLIGNTRSKVWPITMMLIDLPTQEMQRASNLVIQGMVEGSENPSIYFWNAVVPMIYDDIEKKVGSVGNLNFRFCIASWTGDQPAKRALFGMRGCNSEGSCFFGLCTGTHHKQQAGARHALRQGALTDEDGENGTNGFGPVPPAILQFVHPYETIIDLLHNGCEGIFQLIINETLSDCPTRKSDVFCNNTSLYRLLASRVFVPREYGANQMKSGSEKISFFRLNFGLVALINPHLTPKARIIIVSLMLVANQLYTNAPTMPLFMVHLTGAARWALSTSSSRYMSTKCHELLSHLPHAIELFGNIAPLSTFASEHFYKYCLKGFNAQLTNGFIETAVPRAILHSAIRREIKFRASTSLTQCIADFLKATPDMKPFEISWKHCIQQLNSDDVLEELSSYTYYATVTLSIGKLQSTYKKTKTFSDVFFAENSTGTHACYRFIATCVDGDNVRILAERIRPLRMSEEFPLMQKVANEMTRPGNTYAHNVLTQLKRFSGLIHGCPTGDREILPTSAVRGLGAYIMDGTNGYYVQINGGCVHH